MSTESELSTTSVLPSRAVGRRLLLSGLATVVLGVVSGLAWLWIAHPAEWEAREGGIVLTEAAARGQFSVIVVFVVIGLVVSLVGGWALVLAFPDLGWWTAPLVAVLTALAAVIAWRVGVELGPPPPGSVTGAAVGDRIPSELAIDSVAPFLVWPIFGLAGVMAATWACGRRRGQEV